MTAGQRGTPHPASRRAPIKITSTSYTSKSDITGGQVVPDFHPIVIAAKPGGDALPRSVGSALRYGADGDEYSRTQSPATRGGCEPGDVRGTKITP